MARQAAVQYINFYTSGTEAAQLEPVRKKPVTLPKPRRAKRMVLYVDPVAIMGIAVACVLLVSMMVGLVRLVSARQEAVVMENYVQSLQAENEQLQQAYRSGYDAEEIRRIALAKGMIPVEEAKHITITPQEPVVEAEMSAWESFWSGLKGLFA